MSGEHCQIGIVGAGIGGLTAAITLARAGFSVRVYERAEQLAPLGAGLTIQPNAVLALRAMGLGEAIERAAAPLSLGGLSRHDGRPISVLSEQAGGALLAEVGAPILGVHRATLQRLLLEALGPERVALGRAVSGFRAGADAVDIAFADGTSARCEVLVGADGLRSVVRAQLMNDGEPTYAGYTSWRGVTDDRCGLGPNSGGELWGRGQRFGGCAIDGNRYYWFAVANAPAGEREASAAAMKEGLLARFAAWVPYVPALIRSTPEAAILRTDIHDRPVLARWGEGRVTLLGDAAHPMTPNLGQGACQAIEDALVLSQELSRAATREAGLRAYEAARRERANAVVTSARRLGAIAQWQNPLACALRNALFSAVPSSAMRSQLSNSWKLPYTTTG